MTDNKIVSISKFNKLKKSTSTKVKIVVQNISVFYGEKKAINNCNLSVEKNKVTAIIGPSGCGKTTLLRLITGVSKPDAGSIEVGGRVMVSPERFVPPEFRRVGMVFQNYALFPHLNVAANIAYGLHGADKDDQVSAMLQLVGLSGYADRMPN